MTEIGFWQLLKNRPFLTLWIGQILSQIADKVFFVLLIALLVEYLPSPDLENSRRSVLMVAITIPAILLGSLAGVIVDRYSKRQILVHCNLWRGLMTLGLIFLPKVFLVLILLGFMESILTQFFAPAEQTAIPLLVEKSGLLSANALFTTTMMGSMVVGFAVGEPLLTFATQLGEFGPVCIVAVLYILSALVFYGLPVNESIHGSEGFKVHPWADFKDGLRYLKKDRLVSNAMLQLMILYSVFAALTVLTINLAEEVGLKPTQFGFLLAAAGIGMVLGAGGLGHWGSRFHHLPLPLYGFLMMAFALTTFTFITHLYLSLGLSVVLGIGASFIGLPMQTLIQQQTPEGLRGKIFGFQNNVINIALSLPLAIAGPLTDILGLRVVLWIISAIVTGVGIWTWRAHRLVLSERI